MSGVDAVNLALDVLMLLLLAVAVHVTDQQSAIAVGLG